MRLTVVGCSGSAPGPRSAASCYLVEHDGFRLVVDLGSGAFGALQTVADPGSIDAVFLSHLHADHCLDVAPFVVWHRYSGLSTKKHVPLYAPVAAERRLSLAYSDDGDGITDVFDFVPVGPGSFTLGPFGVTLARTAHPIECYAIRLTAGGRSLVYTGDTGPSEAVIELARGADVLLAEAAHPPGQGLPDGLHLTGREAGEHAAAAGVGRLLLTHVPAWVDEIGQLFAASAVFSETELVHSGATYEI
ncbi:MBL fold metallo-hydrolase [Blastococcus sp. CT_GayMR20]|uniref:MBL fold metallo-hydrolase n=1 Tax=Blastococcus sp. CT_GayMR20 TaxID=2559609 RepID=UPI0010739CCC|nr:MBL fold metallo-hydrolase [Blastococcus sp. CT_GayMR20]TFV76614.1 MBL fold metallo-hydrolase [Blastococcus sp. CT_GayMR20]